MRRTELDGPDFLKFNVPWQHHLKYYEQVSEE